MSKFSGNFSRKGATTQRKTSGSRMVFRCAVAPLREKLLLLLLFFGLIVITGCRRDMQDQPKMKPYRGTSFFGDGTSMRQPIEGTIPRGQLRSDIEYYTGKKANAARPTATPATQQQTAGAPANTYPDDVDTFPFPVTKEVTPMRTKLSAVGWL